MVDSADPDAGVGTAAAARRLLASLLATLGLGMASVVWSEGWFWARWRPEDTVGEAIATLAAYSMAVQACLLAAQRWRVAAGGPSGWRRVFLVGALYGWLVEGVLVSTVMDGPPLSWSYTGLAWHALFTVLLGWWWVPRVLAGPGRAAAVRLALLGAGAGLWAAGWRFELGIDGSVPGYAAYVTATTALYGAGLALWWRLRGIGTPGVRGSAVAILGLTAFAAAHAAGSPLTLAGPVLVVLALVALRHTAPPAGAPLPDGLLTTAGPAPAARLWWLALVPATASASYAVAAALPAPVPIGWAFYLVTVPLGAVLFVLAWRRPRSAR